MTQKISASQIRVDCDLILGHLKAIVGAVFGLIETKGIDSEFFRILQE